MTDSIKISIKVLFCCEMMLQKTSLKKMKLPLTFTLPRSEEVVFNSM